MALPGKPVRHRKSKGERHLIGARLPIDDAVKLNEVTDTLGVSVSQYVADLLHDHLATIDPEAMTNQEELPLKHAS
ncbi:hypothetical protein [Arthrobacter rhombi]|uniref:hypothetical protein n=1 Tax=Arthrobacter rhombi TaxID=71253 RepID=UPI003FD47485